jgi:AraC-like DNA-binding protein
VAHAVGYATASAFLAAFRRTVGMPPSAYLSEPVRQANARAAVDAM